MLARATTTTEASCLTRQPAQPARPAGAPTISGGSSDSAGTTACRIGGARPLDAGRFHGSMRQGQTFSRGNGDGGASDSAPIPRWCRSLSLICGFHLTRRIAADGRRHDVTAFRLVVGWVGRLLSAGALDRNHIAKLRSDSAHRSVAPARAR